MRELPKDVLKMASGLISPSGLAGHRRQLCIVSSPIALRPLRQVESGHWSENKRVHGRPGCQEVWNEARKAA